MTKVRFLYIYQINSSEVILIIHLRKPLYTDDSVLIMYSENVVIVFRYRLILNVNEKIYKY